MWKFVHHKNACQNSILGSDEGDIGSGRQERQSIAVVFQRLFKFSFNVKREPN